MFTSETLALAGEIRRVIGYYPLTNVTNIDTSDNKAFGNEEGHAFDVSLAVSINPTQLLNIIGYISNAPSTYDLNNYNCTDFVINIGNLAGLGLPDCYGNWPNGGGSNPGALGQYLRNMNEPSNFIYRQTTTSTASVNTGSCN